MLLSLSTLGLAALLLQGGFQGATTPPSGDTTGYWQQRVHYQIVATLDESQSKLRAQGTLVYTNNSPDTLREMFVHQYLNAFRPASKWSAVDAHEHRDRFQNLREPDYGYERFTQAPVVDGTPVILDYPGSPDSTVAHFKLPRPLAPGDSIRVRFVWDARPSTVTRRQGRKGRTWDFAQWYPKVAVYDRGGWEPNALVPAGELYGEYGTYDVTLVVRDDQILAATGVPVSGDPGWARVSRTGPPRLGADAYPPEPGPEVNPPAGYRAVRFLAHDVHHFAWSASPDYIYEGGTYVRDVPSTHFPTWDTVSVNVLYKPGDDTTWAGGRALERTIFALKWLESIWGPYAYPQVTNVHRLDPGGTEFPMMVMNGGASQGLILHEVGHIFTYGILGNNEWRSGWMDEGLTSYQTSWAQNLTPQEQIGRPPIPPLLPTGYRVNAVTIPPADSANLVQWKLDLDGRAQPIGTNSADFHEFGIYNQMIYSRAELMYGQLRDAMGDSAFRAFFHDYYDRWALKHVDERAMRASVERVAGKDYGWFFHEWIHDTGLLDYAAGRARVTSLAGRWDTAVPVTRRGELVHPMPVGVETASGWAIERADPLKDEQTVHVVTAERPIRVQLDPYHTTWDWDRRDDAPSAQLLTIPDPRATFNWPWLNQADRSHTIVAFSPAAWYDDPQGTVIGARAKTNYLQNVDLFDAGLGFASRSPRGPNGDRSSVATRAQLWIRGSNLYVPGSDRPLMGYGGGFNYLDGLVKLDLYKNWDLSPFIYTPGPAISVRAYATAALPSDSLTLPEQWTNVNVAEVGGSGSYRTTLTADSEYVIARASAGLGVATNTVSPPGEPSRGYLRAEASVGAVQSLVGTASQLRLRVYGGVARNAPEQRAIFASSADPFETFTNDLFRSRGALLKQPGVNYLPLGGAGMRGFAITTALDRVVALNGEWLQRLASTHGEWGRATVSFSAFGDVASASSRYVALSSSLLEDAGAGLVVKGRLYDRELSLRFDAPLFVNHTSLAGWRGLGDNASFTPRWVFTVGDLW
ncbi:MAG TPA: M1 family aminopeptidase [Gemmatimonadaceae bacterium]|nr:M1 family aminopeptidase [Gemmatimonadaceae bacterium]